MTNSSDESLADVVRGQAALIADLQARLDRLESSPVGPAERLHRTASTAVGNDPGEATSRRGFLRLAGAAAAGAAVVAVGNASPAAAAAGEPGESAPVPVEVLVDLGNTSNSIQHR